MKRTLKVAVVGILAMALSACDKPKTDGQAATAEPLDAKTQQLADQCYLGSVEACDAFRAATGEDLPYAEKARKKAAKGQSKGTEF